MGKYSLQQCKDDMCQMWKWLYENPTKSKHDFIDTHPDYPNLESQCAACEYAKAGRHDVICSNCPVTWGIDDTLCDDDGAVFAIWDNATDDQCFADNKRISGLIRRKKIYAEEVYKLALQIKVK